MKEREEPFKQNQIMIKKEQSEDEREEIEAILPEIWVRNRQKYAELKITKTPLQDQSGGP